MGFVVVSCDLTKNRARRCKNTLGGLDIIYIFPYSESNISSIVRNGLILTSFEDTFIYSFAINSGSYNGNSEIDDGGDFINQSLNATMSYLNEDNEWKKLLKKDHCVIFKDNNGKFRLMGAYNGVETEYQSTTGSDYAEFNGWTFNFKAKEEDQPLYFDSLSDVGFTPVGSEEGGNFVFQDGNNFVFQDDNNFILN